MGKIEELEAELKRLRQEERDATEAKRRSVVPAYRYTLEPSSQVYDKVADPSCRWYRLEGKVTNGDQLAEVGSTMPFGGGMNYLFNDLSGRFVISGGGGTIYLNLVRGTFGEADTEAFQDLELLIQQDPEGSFDVTDIVNRARALKGE